MKHPSFISSALFGGVFAVGCFFLFSLSLYPLPTFAAGAGIDALHTFITEVHSARGQFVQRQIHMTHAVPPENFSTTSPPPNQTQTGTPSTGNFVFARPGKFIWNYQTPYRQVLQADGQHFYIYDEDLNQVTQRKLDDAFSESAAAILFGSNELNQNFNLRDAGNSQGIDWVELTPNTHDSQFQRVMIGFRNNNLEMMELDDAFGKITLLTFIHIEKNPPLPPAQFKFKVPAGADVIEDRP